MRKLLFGIGLFLPVFLLSQADIRTALKHSHQVFVYRVSAAFAEKCIKEYDIKTDAFIKETPVNIFPSDSVERNKLPNGQYVMVTVDENRLVVKLFGVSDLYAYPINNQNRVQLLIVNKAGEFVNNAEIWVNGKSAPFSKEAQSYRVSQKKPNYALIKIYTPTDTLFSSLIIAGDLQYTVPKQKWRNFLRSGLVRTISWIPHTIDKMFTKRYPSNNIGARGMIVFNQPKYKQTDTVKLKAYIFNENYKMYRDPVNVFLDYYANGQQHSVFLQTVAASSPGSYIYMFPLSDTLVSDINYTVRLKTKDDKTILTGNFKIEDYLLNDISSYTIRSEKDAYYKGDSLHFFIFALDANGLPVLDVRLKMVLTVSSIDRFYKDTMYVPDTLFVSERPLATSGDTHFDFPSFQLPNADLVINAKIQFKNGNNELQEKNMSVNYRPGNKEFKVYMEEDSVVAEYRVNGTSNPASGTIRIGNDWDTKTRISYPFKAKVDPLASGYTFYLDNNDGALDSGEVKVNWYSIELTRSSRGDTLGFILDNSYAIPVSFSVFDGNKIIGQGKSSERLVQWTKTDLNKNRLYRVTWQYYWGGEEKIQEENIAILYKLLKMDIKSNESVFPGQKDTVAIQIRDYLNKPASGVNLTAFGYNNQLSKDIHVSEPPYLVNYKIPNHILRNKFEQIDGYITRYYPLGDHKSWISTFGLDTMSYYKMLFPDKTNWDFVTPIADIIPEVSVHISKNGERKEIYLLYVNQELVYYNGVSQKMRDAYIAYPGYVQLGIRLYDQFLLIDSVYIQPHYKHDLFFDLDKLPVGSTLIKRKPSYTVEERSDLESSLLTNNFKDPRIQYEDTANYLWQNERLVKLTQEEVQILGPFRTNDSLHFYSANNFDIRFPFDPGYQYEIYPNMIRLEKKPIFPIATKEIRLPEVKYPEWVLGDTIQSTPEIRYSKSQTDNIYLPTTGQVSFSEEDRGSLRYSVEQKQIIRYTILVSNENPEKKVIVHGDFRTVNRITPGEYSLLLVNQNSMIAQINHLLILNNQTLCVDGKNIVFEKQNQIYAGLVQEVQDRNKQKNKIDTLPTRQEWLFYEAGKSRIKGKVLDSKGGYGIPGVTVQIKNTKTGTVTSSDGSFVINNIKPGKVVLVVFSVGYVSKEVAVQVPDGELAGVEINMEVSTQYLNDVVVMGYGVQRKRDLTGSFFVGSQKQLGHKLEKNTYGFYSKNEGLPGSVSDSMLFKNSTAAGGAPVYVIDGIFYDKMPGNISEDMIASVNVLKGEEATAIYGIRGAGGVIEITTKNKGIRNQFRDYAFWEPELFTDENGQVKFGVQYPDNITGWQIFVLAMDKNRRIGKAVSFVKSFKPLVAQLNLPQFLISGDNAEVIGKALNYTKEEYTIRTKFDVGGQPSAQDNIVLKPSQSIIQHYPVVAPNTDSLEIVFDIKTTTGFKDGEERKIPVLKKGTLESNGQFWVLNKDTTVTFSPSNKTDRMDLFAQNNTLDVLLDEIDFLNKYPYYCMEQTSSKLRGLLMEKMIREKLRQPFKHEKTIQMLLSKLQKGQLYDGSWGWWENENGNIYVTNYVIQALLPLRSEVMIETNIRNGLLYLQNQLSEMDRTQLLSTLLTMSESRHLINYADQLQKLPFDSLNIHQQWEYIKIMQNQNIEHSRELQIVLQKAIAGVLGSLHWGEENHKWYGDNDASTVLAFQVLQNEKNREAELSRIFQYFLEKKRNGYWGNTVSSASIVSAILPYALSKYKEFSQPAVLSVKGDTSFTIRDYPFHWATANNINNLTISKTGGGLTYVTVYETSWNENPKTDSSNFVVSSYFENKGNSVSALASGEKVKMIVNVNALKEAEYVMIEIPIPAGCVYGSKDQESWGMHKEFLKNKVVLFTEKLSKGKHQFVVNLESRYNGRFTVNPAKVSLMYFPTFYGRNEIEQISVK